MAARALDFAEAHPSTDASYTALVAKLKERVARGQTRDIQERDGVEGAAWKSSSNVSGPFRRSKKAPTVPPVSEAA